MSEKAEKFGFVYLLCNEAMPGYYKIGATCRPPTMRVLELSASTSIPKMFEIVMYVEVENPFLVESELHSMFVGQRVATNREFFIFSPEEMIEACEEIASYSSLACYGEDYHLAVHLINSEKQKMLEVVK